MSSSNTATGASAGTPSQDTAAPPNTPASSANAQGSNVGNSTVTVPPPASRAAGAPPQIPSTLVSGPHVTNRVQRDDQGNIRVFQMIDDPPPRMRDRVKEGIKDAGVTVANCVLGCCCKVCCGI